MYVDVKVTVWQRIYLNEDETVTKDVVIDAIKSNGFYSLRNMNGVGIDTEYLLETEEIIKPSDNGGRETIELFNDDGNDPIWTNTEL